jgi:hypothetical protein
MTVPSTVRTQTLAFPAVRTLTRTGSSSRSQKRARGVTLALSTNSGPVSEKMGNGDSNRTGCDARTVSAPRTATSS